MKNHKEVLNCFFDNGKRNNKYPSVCICQSPMENKQNEGDNTHDMIRAQKLNKFSEF